MDLDQLCSYDASGIKIGPALGVTTLNIGTKRAKLKNSSSLKLEGLELSYLVYSISTNFIYMMPLGSKQALPPGSKVGT